MRSRDERRNPIRRENVEQDLSYIADFCSSLEMWQTESESIRKLSLPTVTTLIRTCKGMIALIRYLFARYSQLDFILLGNICSDYLEGRFGWYRQLCGANYYNSVTRFLQAEKTIRLRSLVNMGFDMTQIRVMFETAEINQSLEQVEEIKLFTSDLESFKFHNTIVLLLYFIRNKPLYIILLVTLPSHLQKQNVLREVLLEVREK